LERLEKNGFLKNNRSLVVLVDLPASLQFVQNICFMKNLEKLVLFERYLTLEDIALLFGSCHKLTEIRLNPFDCDQWEMDEKLKNQLRPGFQRLKIFELDCDLHPFSWPVLQEILS
jgi:hypothetical protein